MSTTFWQTFDTEYFSGTAAVAGAPPAKYDVSLNGVGYLLDLDFPDPYIMESLPLLAAAFLQDRGTIPIGEHSLNSSDYWRRSVDDWSAGSGQKYLDLPDSIGNQYRTSKGIDPWTLGQISLLPDNTRKVTSSNTTLLLAVAGTYLYMIDGNVWKYTQDVTVATPSFTTLTGAAGDAISGPTSLTSDGYTLWTCDGTRVHYTTRGNATFAKYHTSDHIADRVKSTKGRLLTSRLNILYTHAGAAGSAVATAYYTQPNSDWVWTAIEGGPDAIYFAGFSGDKSSIYAATIKADGTALDAPVVVADLPTGEIVRSLVVYLGVMIIGTDTGFRAATLNATSGSLQLGAFVALSAAPKCFEAQSRFIWFGWTNYDSTSTGLGRIDLSVFNGTVPAYASDQMATTQGVVNSVVTFQNRKVFVVNASGMWVESLDRVASGTVQSGWLNYALADAKVAIKCAIQHRAGAGTYSLAIAVDDNAPQSVGTVVTTSAVFGNNETIAIPQIQGRAFETTLTVNRSATSNLAAPVIDRVTLMVEPQPERRAKFKVPILLHSSQRDRLNSYIYYSASAERARFYALLQSAQIVSFQDFENTYQVIVSDFRWVPYEKIGAQNRWDGTLVAELKVIS